MDQAPANQTPQKIFKMRSPAYPAINLELALKRARVLYEHEKRNAVNMGVAVNHWGFKPKSSGGLVTVAAMKAFGLIADQGSAQSRSLRLTDLALRILLDSREDSPERAQSIKDAALNPKIHRILWRRWGAETPSDGNLRHALIFDYKYNENAVSDVIREYRDTVAFAKLSDSDKLSEGVPDSDAGDNDEADEPMMEQRIPDASGPLKETLVKQMLARQQREQISTPVGKHADGQVVFAHVNFDAEITKEFVSSLKKYLDYLETTLN